MTMFHFCADWMLEDILREGLTKGRVAYVDNGEVRVMHNWQWLTSEPDRDRQEWCNPEFASLPYDRAANRITVRIPKTSRDYLEHWPVIGPLLVPPEPLAQLNAYGDPSAMYLFRGRIPPAWFRKVDRMGSRPMRLNIARA